MNVWTEAVDDLVVGDVRLYSTNSVPARPTYPYVVFSVIDGRGDALTLDGSPGLRWGIVAVQCFSRTLDGASDAMGVVRDALEGRRLDAPGFDCTPLTLPIDPAINRDPDDDGVVGITAAFTFTATKEA